MVLGMSLPVFTAVHVAISLIAIASGIIVVFAMLSSLRLNLLTALFLITAALTSLTGFLFPFHGVTPGIILGVLSLAVLLPATLARYTFHLGGHWRATYIVCSVVALFFNVFVLIAQSFEKVPALHVLAPTGKEPAFMVAQLLNLIVLGALALLDLRRFHPITPALAA